MKRAFLLSVFLVASTAFASIVDGRLALPADATHLKVEAVSYSDESGVITVDVSYRSPSEAPESGREICPVQTGDELPICISTDIIDAEIFLAGASAPADRLKNLSASDISLRVRPSTATRIVDGVRVPVEGLIATAWVN